MPFARPGLSDLIRQALTDLAQAQGVEAVLRYRPDYALGVAEAGLTHGLYGYLDWISRQSVPATSEGEYRAGWAALRGVFPKEGTRTTGSAAFPGTAGAPLPLGTAVRRADGSAAYVTTADATVAGGGTVTVPIQAIAEGPAGNAPNNTPLALGVAVPGITSAGTASGPLTGGTDPEDVDSDGFLTRMLLAYAEPAQGGAAQDYLDWALAVPGVTRAWVAPNQLGAGTVTVRFMMDGTYPGGFPVGTDGVATAEPRDAPATGDQLAVADYIHPRRPVTALVYAVAPTQQAVPITVANLASDSLAIRSAISAALTQALRDLGEPGGTIYPSQLAAAIDGVAGVTHFTLAAPAAPVVLGIGALPVLGALTFA